MVQRAFKFRLKPTDEQAQTMARQAGCARFIWNALLAETKRRLDAKEKRLNYAGMCQFITKLRGSEETAWLAECHVHTQQQKARDLDRALSDCFRKKKGFPKFKKKGFGDSFRYPSSIKVDQSRVWLLKIGWVRYWNSRPVVGTIKQATVTKRGKHWFVSILGEIERAIPAANDNAAVGIDLGVARFATLSDGTFYEPLNAFRKIEKRLRIEQQRLARTVKGSSNRKKQAAKVARLQVRAADARNDHLHKVSTAIAKSHGVVVMEDLSIGTMSKSAAGTVEQPGRNVRAKAGLNKSIRDQGWYAFRVMLGWKLAERGGRLILVNPRNTSRTCPVCGTVSAGSRPSQAVFRCVSCGHEAHADHNAAINILAAGQAASACGSNAAVASEAGTNLEAAHCAA